MIFFKKTIIAGVLGIIVLFPTVSLADSNTGFGLGVANQTAKLPTTLFGGKSSVEEVIGEVIKIALSFIGIVFFILALYAGFIWMKARGNADAVTKSKDTLEAAIIGLVLVLASYAIARFVFASLSGVTNSGTANTSQGGCNQQVFDSCKVDCINNFCAAQCKSGDISSDAKVKPSTACATCVQQQVGQLQICGDGCQQGSGCF